MAEASPKKVREVAYETAVETLSARVSLLEAVLAVMVRRLSDEDKKLATMALDVCAAKYQPIITGENQASSNVLMERMRQLADAYGGFFKLD